MPWLLFAALCIGGVNYNCTQPTKIVPGSHAVATLPVPPAPVPGEMLVIADAGDVLLYNTALWHGLSEHTGTEPRYALLSGWSRPWLWRGWTKPPPLPEVLHRAGVDGVAIFGVYCIRMPPFDYEQHARFVSVVHSYCAASIFLRSDLLDVSEAGLTVELRCAGLKERENMLHTLKGQVRSKPKRSCCRSFAYASHQTRASSLEATQL